ncbi:MAG TPA: hypothetical protein VF727_02400 [Allosphingosinicella sp.]
MNHPFRALAALAGICFSGGLAWAVTLGGYSLDDPEIEEERAWVQGFRQDEPEAARQAGLQCKAEIGRSPWTRDGAIALFRCIRAKGEASGYFYE